jgi:hypothetical protein
MSISLPPGLDSEEQIDEMISKMNDNKDNKTHDEFSLPMVKYRKIKKKSKKKLITRPRFSQPHFNDSYNKDLERCLLLKDVELPK